MPTEQELAEAFTKIIAGVEKFGPGELSQFVMAAIKAAHNRVETDCPHLIMKEEFSWSSKLKPEPKKKKAETPTLFG